MSSTLDIQRTTLAALEASIQAMQAAAGMLQNTIDAAEAPQATELLMPPVVAAPTTSKVWSVHDCHTHCTGKDVGLWARSAVTNGSYGICITPSKDSKDTANMKINGPLGEVNVSKRRWNNAKDITVGDTLYMGDYRIGKVFKGKVVAQPINGPFSTTNTDASFLVSLNLTRVIDPNEVEIVFKVEWNEVASLNDDWKNYLGSRRRITVSPLTASPPA